MPVPTQDCAVSQDVAKALSEVPEDDVPAVSTVAEQAAPKTNLPASTKSTKGPSYITPVFHVHGTRGAKYRSFSSKPHLTISKTPIYGGAPIAQQQWVVSTIQVPAQQKPDQREPRLKGAANSSAECSFPNISNYGSLGARDKGSSSSLVYPAVTASVSMSATNSREASGGPRAAYMPQRMLTQNKGGGGRAGGITTSLGGRGVGSGGTGDLKAASSRGTLKQGASTPITKGARPPLSKLS